MPLRAPALFSWVRLGLGKVERVAWRDRRAVGGIWRFRSRINDVDPAKKKFRLLHVLTIINLGTVGSDADDSSSGQGGPGPRAS